MSASPGSPWSRASRRTGRCGWCPAATACRPGRTRPRPTAAATCCSPTRRSRSRSTRPRPSPARSAAGQMSIHHMGTIHGSGRNNSTDRRIGYSITYLAPHVRHGGKRDSALLVRGQDRYGHFRPDPVSEGRDGSGGAGVHRRALRWQPAGCRARRAAAAGTSTASAPEPGLAGKARLPAIWPRHGSRSIDPAHRLRLRRHARRQPGHDRRLRPGGLPRRRVWRRRQPRPSGGSSACPWSRPCSN